MDARERVQQGGEWMARALPRLALIVDAREAALNPTRVSAVVEAACLPSARLI
jgi:hypothetical protein